MFATEPRAKRPLLPEHVDLSLEQLNGYCADKANFPVLSQNITVNGLRFQTRVSLQEDISFAIFNHDNQKVAAIQDEWGAS